jgi:ADP-ribose pyrophosphatase YjhB (NUDIX family)
VRSQGRKSWDFPGGFLVYGEPPEQGLKRELKEELAAEIKIEGLVDAIVDVYGKYHDFSLNLFYKVSLISNEIRAASEIEEYGWFDIDHCPAIAFKSTVDVLSVIDRYK